MWLSRIITFSISCVALLNGSAALADDPLTYYKDIDAILKKNCVACHNVKKTEGNLILESFEAFGKGGDSGASFTAGKSAESEILNRVTATDDTVMPPKNNSAGAMPLTAEEIDKLKRWIDAGAIPGEMVSRVPLKWQPIPASLQPIYSTTASPDYQFVACGRANQAIIYRLDNAGTPIDQVLLLDQPAAPTHLDMIQAMAFSPDASRLATSGYRDVKIWKRYLDPIPRETAPWSTNTGVVVASKDGTRVAVAQNDGTIDIWNLTTNAKQVVLKGHIQPIESIAWTASGTRLFSSDRSGWLVQWDVAADAAGELVAVRDTPAPLVSSVQCPKPFLSLRALSEVDFAGLTDEKKIERWTLTIPADATMPRTIAVRPFPAELTDVTAFDVVVAEPALIVLAAGNGSLRWIDTNSGQPVRQSEHGAPVHSISISQDNAKVATAGADGSSKIWNFADAQLAATLGGDWMAESLVLRSQREAARRQAFVDRMAARIPELEKAVQAEVDAKKKVEEVRVKAVEVVAAKQQELEKAVATVAEHEKMIADAKAAVEAAMKLVEKYNAELEPKKKAQEAAQVAKAAADMEVVKHDQAIAAADEAINRATAAVPAQQQKVEAEKQVVQAALASVETIKLEAAAKRKPILACAFDREGRTLLTAQDDNTLRAYSVDGSRQTALWQGLTFTPRQLVTLPSGLIVASKPDAQPSLWNSKMEWRLERVIGTPEESPFSDRVTALDFNPDGSLLAVGGGAPSRSGELKIVNVADGAIARDLGPVHSDTVLGAKFSPDGKQIATCGADKLAKIWDVATGQALKTLEGHTHHVLSVAWQDDGFTVATGSADNTVKIWDPATGEQRRTITAFPKEVTSITYVGQSANLLSTCADSQVRLHDTNNGNAIRTFGGATDFLYSLTVSSDNRFAVAGGQDGVLRAWNVENGQLIQQLK